jgi:hypothetical protein
MHDVVAIFMISVAVALATHHGLRGWHLKRQAAWERERAEWRRWIARP